MTTSKERTANDFKKLYDSIEASINAIDGLIFRLEGYLRLDLDAKQAKREQVDTESESKNES